MPFKYCPVTAGFLSNKNKYGWLTSTALASVMALDFVTSPSLVDTKGGKSVTFSRASLATMYDSSGYLTYCPNNLLLRSQEFDHADWSKLQTGTGVVPAVTANYATAPDGSVTADRIIFDLGATPSTATSRLYQFVSGTYQMRISIYLKTNDDTTKNLYMLGGPTSFEVIAVTGTWQRFDFDFTNGSLQFGLTGPGGAVGRTTDTYADVSAWGAQAEVVTYETAARTYNPTTSAAYYGPRFDHYPGTGTARGLLIESARTNLCLYGSDFSNAQWTVANVTKGAAATGPDNVSTSALLITANAGAASHRIRNNVTLTSAVAYAYSAYVKKGTHRYVALGAQFSAENFAVAVFDLDTPGAATQTDVGTTSGTISYTQAFDVGNGWVRLIMVATVTGTACTQRIDFINAATGNTFDSNGQSSFTAAGTETIYVFGFQTELGAFATSYIPTKASSVSRVGDIAQMTGTNLSDWWNATEGTIVCSYEIYNNTYGQLPFYAMQTGDGAAIYAMFGGANNVALEMVTPTYVNQAAAFYSSALNTVETVGVAYKQNDTIFAKDGVLSAQDTSCNIPTINEMGIGYRAGGYLHGWIRSISYYNTRIEDANLETLTA